jgi:HK97 family phage prohead protease
MDMFKLQEGEEVLNSDLYSVEVKTLEDSEGKALKENEIEIIGSSENADRDGEVIALEAWDLKAYKSNPVILAQHNYSKPAIGKASSIKIKDGKLVFKIEFPEDGANPEADIYRKLYKSGFMNASSVGFIPKKWEDGDGKKTPFRKFTKVELLELSLVSVPANSDAVVIGRSMVSKGIISEQEAKQVGLIKGDDPYAMMSQEHKEEHEDIEMQLTVINERLAFIEGFIQGLQKQSSVSETKSYIKDLLSAPKRTEKSKQEILDFVKSINKK